MQQIKLKNGIRAFLAPVEGTAATTVLVMTKVGSRYETEELNGASHFVEHMMFKGTNKLPTPSDISRALDAIGADFNAYTSKEYTGYYIKADSVHQKFAIETLYDMTFDSLYPVAEMDRERNVIIEEINMYEDTPVRHIDDLLEGAMFDGNSLSWEIAGSAETMKTMTRDAVIKFRDDHYTPSRMTIAVAGKVDGDVEEWLNDTFGNVKGDDASDGYSKFEGFKEHDIPPVNMQKKVTEQVHLGLGFPGISYDDERAAAMSVLATLFGGSMSSRLFMSVREKGGLAYRIVSRHSAYEDTGILAILAGLDKSRLSEAMDRIFIEIDDLVKNGPTDEEMQRTKQFIRGHILLAIEDSASRAEWYAQKALFLDEVKTPEERIAAIEAVTSEQVKSLANEIFDKKKMTMSYIGPEEDPDNVRATLPW
ncbi:insulinase family protein [Candidatus Uhrbacteria bacterium]|jgi:predicted Zn-dependent peptidase|nr:insulinase family protein [Candidatus Uhrbacteria bacterium]